MSSIKLRNVESIRDIESIGLLIKKLSFDRKIGLTWDRLK